MPGGYGRTTHQYLCRCNLRAGCGGCAINLADCGNDSDQSFNHILARYRWSTAIYGMDDVAHDHGVVSIPAKYTAGCINRVLLFTQGWWWCDDEYSGSAGELSDPV